MDKYFPMFFNIKDKNIIIFGGGKIALRRTKALIKFEPNIQIVAPHILDDFYALNSQKVKIINDLYNEKYLENKFMVLAITDDICVNNEIYEKCKAKNILVNIASDKEKCDFYFPAILEQESCIIGICGDGKEHKKVKDLKEKLKRFLKSKNT